MAPSPRSLLSGLTVVALALALVVAAVILSARKPARISDSGTVPAPSVEKTEDYDSLMEQATRHVESLQPERSLKPYEAALALRPGDAEALFGRGLARLKLRDAHGAIEDFEAALEAEPAFADALFTLGEALRFSGEGEKAQARYEQYLELDPEGRYADTVRERLAQRKLNTGN